MSLRTDFVLFASQDGANICSFCRRFGISPATGYKWLQRWLEDQGHRMPAFSTFHSLMARHGLLPGASPGIPATGRFEHAAPNRP